MWDYVGNVFMYILKSVYVHIYVYVCSRARVWVRMYIIMSFLSVLILNCNQMLKSRYFWNFFLEIFGGMENS